MDNNGFSISVMGDSAYVTYNGWSVIKFKDGYFSRVGAIVTGLGLRVDELGKIKERDSRGGVIDISGQQQLGGEE